MWFLEKLRLTVDDLIKMREFSFASSDERERRRKEKAAQNRRRKQEHLPNFWVVEDPEHRRHDRRITFEMPSSRRRPMDREPTSGPSAKQPPADRRRHDRETSYEPSRRRHHEDMESPPGLSPTPRDRSTDRCDRHCKSRRLDHREDRQPHRSGRP